MSIDRFYRSFQFFLDQSFGQQDEFFAMPPVAKGEQALHQPQTEGRRLIGFQQITSWRHLDAVHY